MTADFEKKLIQIVMKVPESIRLRVEQIAREEDRPVGYVARELMVRGMALYEGDGRLRDVELKKGHPSERKVNGNVEPVPDERIAYVRNLGELTNETAKPKQKIVKKKAGGRR